jgi:hypothetical protein
MVQQSGMLCKIVKRPKSIIKFVVAGFSLRKLKLAATIGNYQDHRLGVEKSPELPYF